MEENLFARLTTVLVKYIYIYKKSKNKEKKNEKEEKRYGHRKLNCRVKFQSR